MDLAQVEHLSRLARLGLSPEELQTLLGQLTAIVAAVDKLQAADVSSVDPTAQVGGLYDVMRADEVAPSLEAEQALANAPRKEAGLLRVPAIQ
ncbi:MAG: Asp-tRNA(Asn)/Glu-tRNA(Gln) amidotransferase subunit GatC [Candidatus Dormiibacterota bacterium]